MKADSGHWSHPCWRTEAHTAAVVRARWRHDDPGCLQVMLERTANRWPVMRYPASYSCEEAGFGYPTNSQEVW